MHRWRYRIEKRLTEGKISLRPADMQWYLRYFLRSRDDAWYSGLFPNRGYRVVGDITPGYGNLDSSMVAYIHERMPAAKVVFLMRDPIGRAWSALRMSLAIWPQSKADDSRMIELYDALPTTDYVATLDAWAQHYPAPQLFTGFFDDITAEPGRVLAKLCRFLEIAQPGTVFSETAARKFNEGAPRRCRPALPGTSPSVTTRRRAS